MNSNKLIKTGIGYDVHRLLEGSKLINTMAKNKENFNRAKNNLGALKIN